MSDFFDTLGAAAKRAASSVSVEVQIAAEEQKIREAYQALGQLYFKASRTGKPTQGMAFADQCRKVEASLRRINELKRSKNVTDVYAEEADFVTVE